MIYKIRWNEENERFEVASFEKADGGEAKSNLVGQNDGIFSSRLENPQIANLNCMAASTLLAERAISVHRCRECGLFFTVSKEESEWYESNGLGEPKRCYVCRRARKRRNKFLAENAAVETEENS